MAMLVHSVILLVIEVNYLNHIQNCEFHHIILVFYPCFTHFWWLNWSDLSPLAHRTLWPDASQTGGGCQTDSNAPEVEQPQRIPQCQAMVKSRDFWDFPNTGRFDMELIHTGVKTPAFWLLLIIVPFPRVMERWVHFRVRIGVLLIVPVKPGPNIKWEMENAQNQ